MSKRPYVGNLPYSVTGRELRFLFQPYGLQDVPLPTDRDGRPRGVDIVEVAAGHAESAIGELHGRKLDDPRPEGERGPPP